MNKLFLSVASLIVAGPMVAAISSIPANAQPFCNINSDGGGYRACTETYGSCLATASGVGGLCVVNRFFRAYGGYDVPYAYAPGPAYGRSYYRPLPRNYAQPGTGAYVDDDID